MESFQVANNVDDATERLARRLGWFSIGLGLAEVLAPQGVGRLIGADEDQKGTLRAFGLREMASGFGILNQRRPQVWLWSRVAGDAMDLTFLLKQMGSANSKRNRLGVATAAVLGVTALDVICSQRVTRSRAKSGAIHVEKSITINRPPEELYNFWHNFESLPRFMNHLISVKETGENRWHWIAKGPARFNVEWDAEIVDEKPNEYIAWRSLEGADVDNAGAVHFEPAPGGRGTVIRAVMDYRPPAGILGARFAKLFGEEPEMQLNVDLHRFKQMMETGEIPTTSGQPAGRSRSTSWKFDDFIRT
ncbi:SRPBCC family protein [Pedosphaera parvula]|nr:SRPBCC family protein [Pedosphaera parvula]